MDRVAREGRTGLVTTVPDGFEAGSDVANLGLLGYDPARVLHRPGAARGREHRESPSATRTWRTAATWSRSSTGSWPTSRPATSRARRGPRSSRRSSRRSRPSGSCRESRTAISSWYRAAPGDGAPRRTTSWASRSSPISQPVPTATLLLECMAAAEEIFAGHPVNRERIAAGIPPATGIWPWSGGRRPALPPFADLFGVRRRYDLGRRPAERDRAVRGARGDPRARRDRVPRHGFEGKARAALAALDRLDFVYCHVEAPDEAGHMGSIEEKVRAIERVDGMLGTLLDGFDGVVAVLPDHATPMQLRTHTRSAGAGGRPRARHGRHPPLTRRGRRRRETSGGSKRRRYCRSCSGGPESASAPLHHHGSVGVTLIICRPGRPPQDGHVEIRRLRSY